MIKYLNLCCIICWCLLSMICTVCCRSNGTVNNYVELVGEGLYKWNKNHTRIEMGLTEDLLKGKHAVGIYFSASWCGPCRQFTPLLVEYYNHVNKKGKKFEVILVSQDQNANDFIEYYEKMPWLAIPIDQVIEYVHVLGAKYRLKGIPHLVILDGFDASVITLDGRSKVLSDKYGLEYPYRPRSIANVIPRPVRNLGRYFVNKVEQKLYLISNNVKFRMSRGFTTLKMKIIGIPRMLLDKVLNLVWKKG